MSTTQLIACRGCGEPLASLNIVTMEYKEILTRGIRELDDKGKWRDSKEAKTYGKSKDAQSKDSGNRKAPESDGLSVLVCGKCGTSNNL